MMYCIILSFVAGMFLELACQAYAIHDWSNFAFEAPIGIFVLMIVLGMLFDDSDDNPPYAGA